LLSFNDDVGVDVELSCTNEDDDDDDDAFTDAMATAAACAIKPFFAEALDLIDEVGRDAIMYEWINR